MPQYNHENGCHTRHLFTLHCRFIINTKNNISGTVSFDAETTAASFRLPTVNTVMLGLVSGLSGIVSTDEAVSAINGYMPEKIRERNINALLKAAEEVSR